MKRDVASIRLRDQAIDVRHVGDSIAVVLRVHDHLYMDARQSDLLGRALIRAAQQKREARKPRARSLR